jgi:AraC family transcriptional regulator
VFESYVSSGVVEVPEMESPAHVLILRIGSPSVIEWQSEGREHRYEHPPGSVSLIPAGLRRAATVFRPLPGVASILQIEPKFLDANVRDVTRGGKLELVQHVDLRDAQIARLIESIFIDVQAGSPAGPLFGESIATALSLHVARQYAADRPPMDSYRGGLSRSNLNRVHEFIDTHLGGQLELAELADVTGLNLFHFARAFKQSTGESPHQYVLRRRIERAKQFLRDPRSTVLEASARTGFVDQSHFSKVFRRVVGLSPTEFRSSL